MASGGRAGRGDADRFPLYSLEAAAHVGSREAAQLSPNVRVRIAPYVGAVGRDDTRVRWAVSEEWVVGSGIVTSDPHRRGRSCGYRKQDQKQSAGDLSLRWRLGYAETRRVTKQCALARLS
jgi:hypothetical protein